MLRVPLLILTALTSCEGSKGRTEGMGRDGEGTDSNDAVCPGLELPDAEKLTTEPECTAFKVVSWDLSVELQVTLDTADRTYASAPVVAPVFDAGAPSILVLDGTSQQLLAIDGATGEIRALEARENDIEFFAWGFSADGSTRIAAMWNSVDDGVELSSATGAWTHVAMERGNAPSLADLDQDGVPEVLAGGHALSVLGELRGRWTIPLYTLWDLMVVADEEAAPTVVTATGHREPDGTLLTRWEEDSLVSFMGFLQAYPVFGDPVAFLLLDGLGPVALDADGGTVWSGVGGVGQQVPEETGYVSALGDTDGDGEPDLCLLVGDRVVVTSMDGSVLLDEATGVELAWTSGGCALADLDADGDHEVVAYGAFGLRLYDVESRRLLSSREDVCTWLNEAPPVVADVDGDGSAEIVVTGANGGCAAREEAGAFVTVLGPAEGRWARTRPVWNQLAYDPTVVTDGARVRVFPRPNPTTVRAYRAQPAQDGERADLAPEVIDACAESCSDGVIQVSARVLNRGVVDAAAGAELVLYTRTGTDPLREVARVSLPDGVPAGWASEAVVLSVPASEWGDRRVLEVRGDPTAECDLLDDRVEDGIPDPCPGG